MVFVTSGITMDVQRNDSSDALVCNTCKSQIQVSRDYYCSKCEFCLCKRCKGLHSSTHKLIKVKEKYISEPAKKTRLENRYVDEPQGTQESVTYSYAYEHFSTKRFLKGQSSSSESGQNCGDAEQDDYIEIVERPDVPDPAEAKGQKFDVDVQRSELSDRCGVVGMKTLLIYPSGLKIKDQATGLTLNDFPFSVVRRFGVRTGEFYFEVGRRFSQGEGFIRTRVGGTCTTKEIHKTATSFLNSYSEKIKKTKP